jgi:hypothetical protein
MRMTSMVAAAAAVALAGTAIGTPTATATPFLAPAVAQQGVDNPLLHQVWHDRRGHHRYGYRHRDRFNWGSAAVGGILGFGLGAALTAPRYHAPYGYAYGGPQAYAYGVPQTYAYRVPRTYAYGGTRTYAYGAPISSQHVQWCQQRYRSYDLPSDSFLSYDGNRYRCNSPYR